MNTYCSHIICKTARNLRKCLTLLLQETRNETVYRQMQSYHNYQMKPVTKHKRIMKKEKKEKKKEHITTHASSTFYHWCNVILENLLLQYSEKD